MGGSYGKWGTPTHNFSALTIRGCWRLLFLEASQLICGIGLMLAGWTSTPGSSGEGSLLLGGLLGVWPFHQPAKESNERVGESAGLLHLLGYQMSIRDAQRT